MPMTDNSMRIFDGLEFMTENFPSKNSEDPMDRYSISPQEATNSQTTITVPTSVQKGCHDTGCVTGFIHYTGQLTAAHPFYSGHVVVHAEPQTELGENFNFLENPGLHVRPFASPNN